MGYEEDRRLVDEFKATWEAMKKAVDDAKADNRVAIRQLNDRLDLLETKLKRPPLEYKTYDPAQPPSPDGRLFFKAVAYGGPERLRDDSERAAAERLFRTIETKLGPSASKALALGDDTLGGFLAPPEFVSEIVKGVTLISPLRAYARVRPTTARSVQVPVRAGVFAAQWVGETTPRSETTGLAYSLEELTPYEMYAEVLVSLQDLEDTSLDLAGEIASEAAEQFAKAEGTAFVKGDSVRKPEGFMANGAIEHVASGDANLLKADALITLLYSLKEAYARNAVFAMNRKTVGAIRLLKNSQDVYIWEPNFQAGGSPSILGVPYAEMPDMDDVGAGKFPVAVGDFRRGYQIVDRVDVSVQRLNEKYAEQGQVAFLIRKRVGAQVILPEALKKLEVAAS